MRPAHIAEYFADRCLAYAEFSCKINLANATSAVTRSNFKNVVHCQGRALCLTTLSNHVAHVGVLRPKKQVGVSVCTRSVIAPVEYLKAIRDWSIRQFPCLPMSISLRATRASWFTEDAIPVGQNLAAPWPTGPKLRTHNGPVFVNPFPEPISDGSLGHPTVVASGCTELKSCWSYSAGGNVKGALTKRADTMNWHRKRPLSVSRPRTSQRRGGTLLPGFYHES